MVEFGIVGVGVVAHRRKPVRGSVELPDYAGVPDSGASVAS
ncbi:hypothetical protein ACWEVP_40525 [Amycolatopsis sp. NPDC003865]